jgi:hypothetical protein
VNRAARRAMGVRSTGFRQRTQRRRLPESPPAGGAHQWVVTAAWQLSADAARRQATGGAHEEVFLDLENLLTVDGPGCWVCEQIWTEAIADQPCPGDPSRSATG